jgi:eukaryotic-like serine/threonine-protein kinase
LDSLIGTSIGGYTLIQLLGSGGMGTVYLAQDPTIGQQVAIKVVRTDPDSYTDMSAALSAAERFKQEARAVASMDHLHILPLYRYGEEKTADGQRAYIIMQYRPEGSLWDWLRRRAELALGQAAAPTTPATATTSAQNSGTTPMNLPFLMSGTWPVGLSEAGEYLRQAASALQYAHERGIIHRDVKPANFLLRVESGNTVHLLLSDFGLAKVYSSNSATSHVLGTPIYMAPEQFEGTAVPETDQYALAVMIYYLLAGHPPFEGEPMRLMHQHLTATPPPITTFNPALPESIGSILTRALAKNPAGRFPSTAEFAAAFTQAEQDAPTSVRPFLSLPTLSQANRPANYAPTVLNPVANTPTPPKNSSSGLAFQPTAYVAPPVPAELNVSAGQSPQFAQPPASATGNYPRNFSGSSPTVTASPLSPAPSQPQQVPPAPLVKSSGINRRGALGWILGGVAVAAIAGGGGFYFYSRNRAPDNAKYVLRGHSDIVTSVFWSPDGTQLVSGSRDNTARIWTVANQQNTATYTGHSAPLRSVVWSPDTTLLASGSEDQTVQIWDTGAVRHRSYGPLGAIVSTLAWDSQKNAILAGTLGAGGYALSVARQIAARNLATLNLLALTLSPDSAYLAVATASGDIVVFTTSTPRSTAFARKLPGNSTASSLAWSLDSTRLAAGSTGNEAIIWAASGRQLHRLSHNAPVNSVAWNPNNANQLATGASDGTLNIWDITGLSPTKTTYSGFGGAINAVTWSIGGLASGDSNNNIIVWQI